MATEVLESVTQANQVVVTKLLDGVGAAIGCRFLRTRNQVAFVEYSKGTISLLDVVRPAQTIVSQGTTVLKGTWIFDCETGAQGGGFSGPGDIWWEQMDNVKRQMVPVGGAGIVNLGTVNFANVTPAVLQTLKYGKVPIPGNNDASNQLVTGDVFGVLTNAGNFAKILVVQYGYDMKIQWVTYKLASGYHPIGTGYMTPEDIVVASDEKTAYVTQRTGEVLKVDLGNANRAAATVIASGLEVPCQMSLDEVHQQLYVVEWANSGHLFRIDLKTKQRTVLLNGLNYAVGLLLSPDLAYAYISEGGNRIGRYSLADGARSGVATGLVNPFFLTWADTACSSMYVAERAPANRITAVDTVPHPGSVRPIVTNVGANASSVALIDSGHLVICCNTEIDCAALPPIAVDGLFKGIGLVPFTLMTPNGLADTTKDSNYPYQFAPNAPFGGVLSPQVNHELARLDGLQFYRILVDGTPRTETWWNLELNPADGKYDIDAKVVPQDIGGQHGYYPIRPAGHWYMNPDLALVFDSTTLANGPRTFAVEFTDAKGQVMKAYSYSHQVHIDNRPCTAVIGTPTVAGQPATTNCGILAGKKTDQFQITYTASHPALFATYEFWIVKAASGFYDVKGDAAWNPVIYNDQVDHMLGNCPAAAFAAELAVWAKAINGISRQSQYDAYRTVAFALLL
jgi:hypothetical protein